MGIDHVVVVVPARDEYSSIRASLTAIQRARLRLPSSVSSSLCVVADCCSDGTVDVALDTLRHEPDDVVLITTSSSAGAARAVGTRHGLADLDVPMSRVWVANTDADTVVPENWLTTQLAAATEGFLAIAGVVDLEPGTVCDSALWQSFSETYIVYPDGSHPHVHGANLGFRADAYLAVGGWNPLAVGEDHDLWNRLRVYGPVTSRTALSVSTSARLVGRAPAGFAADLAALVDRIDTVA